MSKPKIKTYRTLNDWLIKGRRVKDGEHTTIGIHLQVETQWLFEKSQTEKMDDEQVKEISK